MLKNIKVLPLAAESLGVRSMCTLVETRDLRILLDAGVSLCPNRFGLPPHPHEFQAISECRRRIAEAARKSEIVTISHYHFDHHTPSFEDWLCNWTNKSETAMQIYAGKTVLMKNPKESINPSQRRRAWMFERTGGKFADKLDYSDGKAYSYRKTEIRFSEPVFHGADDSFLGWVIMVVVESNGEKFLFAPDVQGPMSRRTLDMITREKPHMLMIGGPPSYLAQNKINEEQVKTGLRNLASLADTVPFIIVEHHLLRDEKWREQAENVLTIAEKSRHEIVTAAEFLGKDNQFLEAGRKRLYLESPPSESFRKWMRTDDEAKKHEKPPI